MPAGAIASNKPPPARAVIVTVHVFVPPLNPAAPKSRGFANASAIAYERVAVVNLAPAKEGAFAVVADVVV